jgi:hypothetical protein
MFGFLSDHALKHGDGGLGTLDVLASREKPDDAAKRFQDLRTRLKRTSASLGTSGE